MIRNVLGIALIVAGAAIVFAVGYANGQHHPAAGNVLVPAQAGTPTDLPAWACEELVNARIDRLLASGGLGGTAAEDLAAVRSYFEPALAPRIFYWLETDPAGAHLRDHRPGGIARHYPVACQ